MTNEKVQGNKVIESGKTNKAPYQKPSLLIMGKLTSLTMGSRPGGGESGNPALFDKT